MRIPEGLSYQTNMLGLSWQFYVVFVIRVAIECWIMSVVYRHSHWSVFLVLLLITIRFELEALHFNLKREIEIEKQKTLKMAEELLGKEGAKTVEDILSKTK